MATPPKLGFFYSFLFFLDFPDQFSLSEISITVELKLWNTESRPKVNSSPISPSWGSVFTPWLTRAGSTVSTEYESWLRALFSSSPKVLRSSPLSHPVIVNFASDSLINSAANESIPLSACVEERLERFRALPRLRAAEESLERWRMSQPCRGITWPPAAESSSSETCIISGAPRSTASTAAWHRGQWPEHISPTEPCTGLMILPQASYKSDLKISGQQTESGNRVQLFMNSIESNSQADCFPTYRDGDERARIWWGWWGRPGRRTWQEREWRWLEIQVIRSIRDKVWGCSCRCSLCGELCSHCSSF